MGIDVTISSAQCHTHCSGKCKFFVPSGRTRSFVIVCLSLPLPLVDDVAHTVATVFILVAHLKFHLKKGNKLDMY